MRVDSKDWPEIERAVFCGEVKTFRTKADALSHGRYFGWSHAFRLLRRFECVWIVGKKDFQGDVDVGLSFDVIRVPLLRWDVKNSIKSCPVVKFRKYRPS